MFSVEMANVNVLRGYDLEVGSYETYIHNCLSKNDAELALEENVYQGANDMGYTVKKVSYQDFSWMVFGSSPIIYKFTNSEDPQDIQYSTYRIIEEEF